MARHHLQAAKLLRSSLQPYSILTNMSRHYLFADVNTIDLQPSSAWFYPKIVVRIEKICSRRSDDMRSRLVISPDINYAFFYNLLKNRMIFIGIVVAVFRLPAIARSSKGIRGNAWGDEAVFQNNGVDLKRASRYSRQLVT